MKELLGAEEDTDTLKMNEHEMNKGMNNKKSWHVMPSLELLDPSIRIFLFTKSLDISIH